MELHHTMQLACSLFTGVYLSLIFILSLYGLHRCWILYLYFRYYKWVAPVAAPLQTTAWPKVTVQLPVYNERYVVARLIDCVAGLDYPREQLEIQVLDDSTDDTCAIVAAKVAALRAQGIQITHLQRPNRIGFKAGALEFGLNQAAGEYLAIFDADFLPPADFLKKTVPYFQTAGIGMVQTRWGHLNEDHSLLTWVQSLFLDGHFLIEHTARNRSGAFFNFNGTAGVWRRDAIVSAGGWQHDTLTEDLDLSYRAQMKGWKFVFLPDVVCPAELPVDINAFKTQQHRWTMGAIQTAKKMLPTIWASDLSLKVKIEATFHLTACVGYMLMVAVSLLLPLSLFFRSQVDWPLLATMERFALLGTTASLVMFYAVCQRDLHTDWKFRIRNLPVMISIGVGMCISNAKAVIQGMVSHHFEFNRTPKYSVASGDASWKGMIYRSGNSFAALTELAFAAYFVIATGVAYQSQQWSALPFIALFGFGYLYVAFLTAMHGTSWGEFAFLKKSSN
jgi:cellulose synthase/poly-beta-1,6-N-acetylglucosamine synthase-like glycosyltransferase